ncbi:electron transfer flavoprotein subunit alpha/FixB family protein [Propionivibrio soli]|uniref:electron transfer flavoprotein subunit alpha/FixB family protein n=1 Tax=Propionivibrio soli TaxID=2976531 RepID=UPI0021E7B927|nr:FAD-binding protein [Propionivibrio soli]
MSILVIAEHDNAALKSATLNAVTAAAQIGGDIHLLVAGAGCGAVAETAATIDGVAKVLLVDAPHYGNHLPENLAVLVAARAQGFTHILSAATTAGKNLMPRVAALLDVAQISEIVGVKTPDTFDRFTYAGNVLTTVQSADPVKVLTIRTTAFPAAGEGGHALVETLEPAADVGVSRLIGRELTSSSRPELATAKVVVCGGRGLGSGENYHALLEPLADKLGAALGASRAAVDSGFAPNDYQVGQTGKVVAPELYIAVGISGAIQHVAGMQDSRVIVAINKDPEAPIFQIADYGLVGDLFDVVPALTAAL